MIVRKWSNQNAWQLQWKYRTLFPILHQQQQTTWATYIARINCLMLTSTEHSFKLVLFFQTCLRLRCWFACLVSCLSSITFIENCCLSSFFFPSQNTFKQHTRLLVLIQLLLCCVQLVLELLFWNFRCPYIYRSTRRCARMTFQLRFYRHPRIFKCSTAKESPVEWCPSAQPSKCCVCCIHTGIAVYEKLILRKINTGNWPEPVSIPPCTRQCATRLLGSSEEKVFWLP